MGRKFFVGGNWKCNGTVESIKALIAGLNAGSVPPPEKVEVVVAPVYIHIPLVKETLRPDFKIAAQDVHFQKAGAFTGAISPFQLKDLGIDWTLLGHSERRSLFGDTDEIIAKKTALALEAGLSIIACIGETLDERKAGKTLEVCITQLNAYKSVVKDWSKIVIAYEPVWAIGTGVTASPEQAQEVHEGIRKYLTTEISPAVAESTRILYGGSVTAATAAELGSKPDIDGFLVGGASLKAPDFLTIINAAQ